LYACHSSGSGWVWHSLASHDYSHLRHIYWRCTSCCDSCGCL